MSTALEDLFAAPPSTEHLLPKSHTELPLDINSQEWQWAENLIRDVEEEERKGEFAAVFFSWKMALRQFRRMEHKTFSLRKPSQRELDHHKACVTALISIGSFLKLESAKYPEATLKALGIIVGEIDAHLYELQSSFEERHADVDVAHCKGLADQIFCG